MSGPGDQNLVLTGFMGTGKTTVGRVLAERLSRPLVDTDEELERRQGRDIPSIFAEEGEAVFRRMEHEVILWASALKGHVITVGGGAVLREDNREALAQNGLLICLRASPETILERISADSNRPLLAGRDRLESIQSLLAERGSLYDRLPYQVDTEGLDAGQVAERILEILTDG